MLDELSQLIVPTDLSSVSRSIETVLAIYHSHTTNLKMLNNRNSQDVRQTIDDLLKQFQSSVLDDQTADLQSEIVKETPIIPQPPPTTPASVIQVKEQVQATQTHPDGKTCSIDISTLTSHSSSSNSIVDSLRRDNTDAGHVQHFTSNKPNRISVAIRHPKSKCSITRNSTRQHFLSNRRQQPTRFEQRTRQRVTTVSANTDYRQFK